MSSCAPSFLLEILISTSTIEVTTPKTASSRGELPAIFSARMKGKLQPSNIASAASTLGPNCSYTPEFNSLQTQVQNNISWRRQPLQSPSKSPEKLRHRKLSGSRTAVPNTTSALPRGEVITFSLS